MACEKQLAVRAAVASVLILGPTWMQRFRRISKNQDGNVAIMFATAIIPLLLASGMAIDFGNMTFGKASADAAGDAAVLFAVKTAEDYFDADVSDWKNRSQDEAKVLFGKNLKAAGISGAVNVDVDVKRQNGSFSATLTYDVEYPTMFMQMVSQDMVMLRNSISAEVGSSTFISVRFVVDNSNSMGIGANAAVQNIMKDDADMGHCAFACHYPGGSTEAETVSVAKSKGYKLRIDMARDAIRTFLVDLEAGGFKSNQVEVALHTYSSDLQTVLAPTTDIENAVDAVDNIQLETTFGEGGSNLEHSLKTLTASLSTGGDGTTPSSRKSYVIILGDGVETNEKINESTTLPGKIDWNLPREGLPRFVARPGENFQDPDSTFTLQAPKATSCDGAKNKNHSVMVAQIAYVTPPDNPIHDRPWDPPRIDYINNVLLDGVLQTNLQACATQPDHYIFASESAEIAPAFETFKNEIKKALPLRLTQ